MRKFFAAAAAEEGALRANANIIVGEVCVKISYKCNAHTFVYLYIFPKENTLDDIMLKK